MSVIASLKNAKKIYKTGDTTITALDTTTVDIHRGQLTLVLGPSGSGKTTLISLIGCVIYPTEGQVFVDGKEVTNFTEKQLAGIRLNKVGFIFQHFNLIQPLTALENVMQPLLLRKVDSHKASEAAKAGLQKVGLSDRKHHLPKRLSGGQKQRVAIARALVTDAPILLCDEPTASLDAKSGATVMQDLKNLAKSGKAVIVVTHDLRLRQYADRIIYVEEGQVSDTPKDETLYK